MAEQRLEIRRVAWHEVLPFLRLFSTFWRSLSFGPLLAAFAALILVYGVGRIMDPIWVRAGHGVLQNRTAARSLEPTAHTPSLPAAFARNEIQAFASLDHEAFNAWRTSNAAPAIDAEPAAPDAQRVNDALALIRQRTDRGISSLRDDAQLNSAERHRRATLLRQQADVLRFRLAGSDHTPYPMISSNTALEGVLAADRATTVGQRAEESRSLAELMDRAAAADRQKRTSPRGPFASLLDYEMRCFASAIQGVARGRWGLQAGAADGDPAFLGSLLSAGRGLLWLVSQRPGYALVFAALALLLAAPFCGVICRLTAIGISRDELGEFSAAFSFLRERYAALIGAPLMCLGLVALVALLMALGGLFGAIPYVGPVLYGLTMFLAMLGGAAIVFFSALLICGFPLMGPTTAVEGSDAFDALQRAGSYTFQKPGLTALFWFMLAFIGALACLAMRLVVMLTLKATHAAIGLGMNVGSSSRTDSIGRLDAMWWMPPLSDLSILPRPDGAPLWGIIRFAPLSASESFGAFFCALWVFLAVGLLGAYLIAFFWVGATQVYYLLRHAVDGADITEIYFEEQPDPYAPLEPAKSADSASPPGHSLPVVNPPS